MKRLSEAPMPTEWGNFTMIAFGEDDNEAMPHLAMVSQGFDNSRPALLRIHSECMTGDVFHSRRCDCGAQLERSMNLVAEEGGLVIYLRQEGRGIGLVNKLKAYQLQDKGLDTVEANVELGHPIDGRNYNVGIQILEELGITQVRILTNNPKKMEAFEQSSIEIVERVPLIIPSHKDNEGYLGVKKKSMGHLL